MKNIQPTKTELIPFGDIDLSTDLEELKKKWRDDIKQRLTQRGVLEKITTDISHVLERTNVLSPNPNSDVNITYNVYKQLYQEVQNSIHQSTSREINQYLESEEKTKQTIRSTVIQNLEENKEKYTLESNPEKIKQHLSALESTFTENKKETKKTKKRRIEEIIPDDEPFITCGKVNSRGRPCMRRQGTCPYHSVIKQ